MALLCLSGVSVVEAQPLCRIRVCECIPEVEWCINRHSLGSLCKFGFGNIQWQTKIKYIYSTTALKYNLKVLVLATCGTCAILSFFF